MQGHRLKRQDHLLIWFVWLILLLSSCIPETTANISSTSTVRLRSNQQTVTRLPLILLPPLPGFYVAPNGKPNADGSWEHPWDLKTALDQPDAVTPGATIWLRGGIYTGSFISYLTGTEAAPITVRQYPGEQATIDRHSTPGERLAGLSVYGAWSIYWGFEVMDSNPERVTSVPGENPAPTGGPLRPNGLQVYAPHSKFINLVVHDTAVGIGFWSDAVESEIYGSLIYNNGWQGPDKPHDHGIYTQNVVGTKQINDNIIFNQFDIGIHAYSQEKNTLSGFHFEGNVSFNNGSISKERSVPNIFVGGGGGGGDVSAERVALISNYTYRSVTQDMNVQLGFDKTLNKDLICRDNYFLGGGDILFVKNWNQITMTGNALYGSGTLVELPLAEDIQVSNHTWNNNTYFETGTIPPFSFRGQDMNFEQWQQATAFDQNSQYVSGRPTGVKVFVRPNKYEPGRANIIIYSWDLEPTVDIDVSNVLKPGATYELRNAQDYFGAPVASGIYDGSPLHLSMAGIQPVSPIGGWVSEPPITGPEFNVFVLSTKG